MRHPFVKGHGTRNDFIVLPDPDGTRYDELNPSLVRALCDRRSGIGADGVLRVLRGAAAGNVRRAAGSGGEASVGGGPEGTADWFMDYRNGDGSVSAMCGNGIRVFARYLASAGLVDPAEPLLVGTLDGPKRVTFCADGDISVDLGRARVGPPVQVRVDGSVLEATSVHIGNPHAVAFVESVAAAGPLMVAPGYSAADFPEGVNVEFVQLCDDLLLRMRVFERGVGETQSCGTGACAAVAALAGSAHPSAERPGMSYTVEVAGGALAVTSDEAGHLHLKGPAALVAEGTWTV